MSGAGFGSELERRRRAVEMVVAEGLGPSDVAEQVGRSREWVHKWLRRFREEGEAGLVERSRAPKIPPAGVGQATVVEVLRIRAELTDSVVASVGAETIYAQMERNAWEPLPSVRSIERILHRAGVTRPYRRHRRSGARLPLPRITRPGVWQQADWIHDRWLQGGIHFNSIQAVDVASWAMASTQYLTRHITNACEFLFENAWPTLSIPLTMGVDNAFVKTTHRGNPFTLFTRLCLFYGAEVLVAPPGGLGWTNQIESTNNLWQARTIRARHFSDLDELRAGSQQAVTWLNHSRAVNDPAIHGTRYPIEVIARHADTLRWPPTDSLDHHRDHKGIIRIPLTTGRLTFIRHTSESHTIDVANTTWPLPTTIPTGALILATITTADHTLTLRHNNQIIATHPYPITHPITEPHYPPADHGLLDQLSAMS